MADRLAAVLDIDPAKVGINLRDHRITLAVPDADRLVSMVETASEGRNDATHESYRHFAGLPYNQQPVTGAHGA